MSPTHLGDREKQTVCHFHIRAQLGTMFESTNDWKKDIITHLRNWAQSVHNPLHPLENNSPCIRETNCRHGFFGALESIFDMWHPRLLNGGQQNRCTGTMIRRRCECSTVGALSRRGRSFSKSRRVGFGRLKIGGVDGQGQKRSCVR